MKEPLLSIIVPIYRVEAYLPRCIDSILAQTFADFELILVDDGSPDGCPALCDAAAQRDPRVRVIHQKNGGLSAARNAGLDAARGQWIGFVDSDDYAAPEMYETLLRRVRADDAQLAVCSYYFVREDGTCLPVRSAITKDEVLDRVQALERVSGGYFTIANNRLYQRSLFDTVRFPVGKLHEDEYVTHQIFWQCRRISVVAQPLYFYLQREEGISKQKPTARRCLDKAEGVFSRAQFAWEQGLPTAAFPACAGAIYALAQAWALPDRSPAETLRLQELTRKAKALAQQLLRVPGPGSLKARMRLFLLSPRLYWKTVHLYSTWKTRQNGRTGETE